MFTVTPQDLSVSAAPVTYDFSVQPSGDLYKGAYLVVKFPPEVELID